MPHGLHDWVGVIDPAGESEIDLQRSGGRKLAQGDDTRSRDASGSCTGFRLYWAYWGLAEELAGRGGGEGKERYRCFPDYRHTVNNYMYFDDHWLPINLEREYKTLITVEANH